jgi:hypothetical protein
MLAVDESEKRCMDDMSIVAAHAIITSRPISIETSTIEVDDIHGERGGNIFAVESVVRDLHGIRIISLPRL